MDSLAEFLKSAALLRRVKARKPNPFLLKGQFAMGLILFMCFCIPKKILAQPDIIQVGPNQTYQNIFEAIQGENLYSTFTSDVTIQVEIGSTGYDISQLVDGTQLGDRGPFTFLIEGVSPTSASLDENVTYYVD